MRISLTLSLAALASPLLADPPSVVADIPPVHALVAQVMGDLGAPLLLMDAGANPHGFQMRPSQAAALAGADLLVWVGPEMTPWLERALAGTGTDASVLGLLAAEGTFRRDYGDHGGHDHGHRHEGDHGHGHDHADDHDDHDHDHTAAHDDHDHDHDEDHAHGHDHEGHDHGDGDDYGHDHGRDHDHGHGEHDHDHAHDGADPHAWLDPANARRWLELIAGELARIDPGNADTYAANAAGASARIAALDAGIAAALAPVRDRPFVVFHDAYGYFAGHYGLTVAGAIALGDAATPGAARLRGTQDMLRAGGVVCAFPEAGHDARLVATVTEGTGVRTGPELDPEGAALEIGPGLYEALMQRMADRLIACLAE